MMRSKGAPVAATFADTQSARACRDALKQNGFAPWMAVLGPSRAPETAGEAGGAPHTVAQSSDGIVGAIGRYFSGERSLRHSLVEHGLSEAEAVQIDESVGPDGAVIVIPGGDRSDEAASLLSRGATHVIGAHGEAFERYPSSNDTLPGQGDELDRGTDLGRSGGGLGATTGFWDEHGAQKDIDANDIYYERAPSAAPSASDEAAEPFGEIGPRG